MKPVYLIFMWTIVVCFAIVLIAGFFAPSSHPELPPEPSRLVSKPFEIGGIEIHEFRDSAGRVCVIVYYNSPAIDCGYPIDYDKPPITYKPEK